MPKLIKGKTPREIERDKRERASLTKEQAIIDYNIMMEILEDPSEGEEDESLTEI